MMDDRMDDKSADAKKVVLLAEFDRNRDGREAGCRDYSGTTEEHCDPQTNIRKKTRLPSPTRNERIFFRSLTEIITIGNDN